MFPLSGLSNITQTIWRSHWLPWLPWFHSEASSPSANTLTINNEESRTKRKSSGDTVSTPGPNRKNTKEEHVSDEDDKTQIINDVESLKKGIIKTSKNRANKAYTILLVGETGVGKSSVLELVANILIGNDTDHFNFGILDRTNEQGGFDNQSQTNSAHLYEFTSKNGITVRILDTPGLADSRGVQQDEPHKRSIATQIKDHNDSITAVLVLANGTVPRVTAGTEFTLSTLSAISPRTLSKNTALLLTNTSDPLYQNLSGDILPEVCKDVPQFLLNNPISLQRRYLELKDKGGPNTSGQTTGFREVVKASEQDALEMLVGLFDWLDGLDPPKTQNILIGNA